jgi:hypothetical protein
VVTVLEQCQTLYEIATKQSYNKQVMKVFKVIDRISSLKNIAEKVLGHKF